MEAHGASEAGAWLRWSGSRVGSAPVEAARVAARWLTVAVLVAMVGLTLFWVGVLPAFA